MSKPIVVGVDGSAECEAAIDLAAQEAAWRGAPLRVVHGFAWPYMRVTDEPLGVGANSELRMQAEKIVTRGRDRAALALRQAGASDAPLTSAVVTGFPAATLIAESRHAAVVVVGNRGLGGFSGLLLGSVAAQLVTHAFSPVLIARGRPGAIGDVVVGVDGSAANRPAITFAFEEAARRNCGLRAVLVWAHPKLHGRGDTPPLSYDAALLEDEVGKTLHEAVASARDEFPDVPVKEQLIRGRTRHALIDASRDAGLIVVGRSGYHPKDWILGAVSSALIHRSECPVAVVSGALGGQPAR